MESKLLRVALVTILALASSSAGGAGGVEARAVFDQLKSLAGTWEGQAEGAGEAADAEAEAAGRRTHEIRVSAAGTVVMEIMGPGTDHEMINMYHLDGEDLRLTHYCAGGNQPQMKLDRDASTAEELIFGFAGGTNLDPAVDEHIHAARIEFIGNDELESDWFGYAGGEQVGVMKFHLTRTK